jgi:hypothetical protein
LPPFEDVDGWKKRFNEIWRGPLLQEIRASRAIVLAARPSSPPSNGHPAGGIAQGKSG